MNTTHHNFKVGDFVRWEDPEINDYEPQDKTGLRSRVYVIDYIDGDFITISGKCGTTEVRAAELEAAE